MILFRTRGLGGLAFAVWLAHCVSSVAQPVNGDRPLRLLAIYSNTSTLTANVSIAEGLRTTLDGTLFPGYDIYTEFRGLPQFPGAVHDARFVDMLAMKYSEEPVDVVLAIGPEALNIVLEHRTRFAPDTPVVGAGVSDRFIATQLPDDVYLAQSSFDIAKTVALARRMQPDARELVVFTGSSGFDKDWQQTAREALSEEPGLELDFVSELTLEEFAEHAAGLDRDAILLILTIFEDSSGARFMPAEAAKVITARSAAPSWAVYQTFLEDGVVGGQMQSFENIGRALGDLALDVLDDPNAARKVVAVPQVPILDWEQLRRYGLDEALVPDEAVLLNYDPTAWERYRVTIFGVLAVILAQSVSIAALIVQGRRRQAAQRELAEQRLELARLSRISQLGALSGAITHELNQPLTAILANSEAGTRLLARDQPDLKEVADILEDIAEDDRRAAKIISDLRHLMHGGQTQPKAVELNAVVRDVVDLVRSETIVRSVRVDLKTAPRPLVVLGDTEQFKQVLLNLLMNAMDAMAEQPPETRNVRVEVNERADGWREIVVQDEGPGLAKAVSENPFKPFSTTKDAGLGMGLVICQTIAEAHGGKLAFEPCTTGARAVFSLPPG